MDKIEITLFGNPQIFLNGEAVLFPYNKINALIYLLATKNHATRDEIANILWPDENEKIAKKNLRNALYQAKKNMGIEFIISPKKSFLELNPDVNIVCDAIIFDENPEDNLDLYSGEFLQGFFVKDSEPFDYWLTKMRNHFNDKFVNISYQKLALDLENENFENFENNINSLISIDEYDERSYRLLMNFYKKTNRNGKVIETYQKLNNLLQDELGVSPDNETKSLYEDALQRIDLKTKTKSERSEYFYGRESEIEKITNGIVTSEKSYLVYGEVGIGKSALKRIIVDYFSDEAITIEVYCYQAERDYSLRPISVLASKISKILDDLNIPVPKAWSETISKLFPSFEDYEDTFILEIRNSLNFDVISKAIVDALTEISKERRLLIVFEDIQWMDAASLKVLTSVILRLKGIVNFYMNSRMSSNNDLDSFIATLVKYDVLERVELERFNKEDTSKFLEGAVPKENLNPEVVEKIYNESEGNPLFISEYINILKSDDADLLMTQEIMDSINSRFTYLSKSERDILDIVSYFYDEASLNIISEISGQSELEVIGLIENLVRENIIKEIEHKSSIGIVFTHSKLREYIYLSQPNSKRRVIHRRIGQIMEENLNEKKDVYAYSKLSYHFNMAGDLKKSIKYEILNLKNYFNFSHELFPTYEESDFSEDEVFMSKDRIRILFRDLESNLNTLHRQNYQDVDNLEIEFYFLKGRFLIKYGFYEEGLKSIKYVIKKTLELDDKLNLLEAYKQMIFYYIQINDSSNMIEYINLALDLALDLDNETEIGVILRLKGLYNFMSGNFDEAKKYLIKSIETLESNIFSEDNLVAINASKNYLGEIEFQLGNYKLAEEIFSDIVSNTESSMALTSLSVFLINKGKALYAMNDINSAIKAFIKSESLYECSDNLWKRAVLDSYLTLCYMKKSKLDEAKLYFDNALIYFDSLKDPRSIGTHYFTNYILMISLDKNTINKYFNTLLENDSEYYKNKALEYLDKNRDGYEINILNN